MTPNRRLLFTTALAALGAVALLGGCGNEPGYGENAPPPGGPQQNSHMPPGELAKTAQPNQSSASSH